jgi:chromosome segregation ATPase
MSQQTTTTPTFRRGLGRFLGGCLRLLVFGLLVAALTAAIYYATPYVYRYFVIPVQNNRLAIEQLRNSQARFQDDLEARFADQSQRIAQLEADLSANREARSELENVLAEHQEMLSAQGATQVDIEADLEAQGQTLATLEQDLDTLDAAIAEVEQSIAVPEAEIARLQRRVSLVEMQQATLKARLHLSDNDAGQARLALEDARQPLQRLRSVVASGERAALAEIEEQLDTVTTAIEEQPFTAVQELEIMWQLLQEFSER